MADLSTLMTMSQESVQKKVHVAKSQISSTTNSLKKVEAELKEARSKETLDEKTGISLDKSGKSMAHISVLVINGRDMPIMNTFNGKSDAYVEVTFDPPEAAPGYKMQKSETAWATLDPSFQFQVKAEGLQHPLAEASIVCKVYDDVENIEKLVKKRTFIGSVTVPFADLMDQEQHSQWYTMDIDAKLLSNKDLMGTATSLFSSGGSGDKKIGALQIKSTLFYSSIGPLVPQIAELKAKLQQQEQEHTIAVKNQEAYLAEKQRMAKEGEQQPLVVEKKEEGDPNVLKLAPPEGEVAMHVHRNLIREPFTTDNHTDLEQGTEVEVLWQDSTCYFKAQITMVHADNTYDVTFHDSTVNNESGEPDFFDQFGILRRKDGEGTPLRDGGELEDSEKKPNWLVAMIFGDDKKDIDEDYSSTENTAPTN